MTLRSRGLTAGRLACVRSYSHAKQLEMLSAQDLRVTFPENSKHLNERHFYQTNVSKWVERPPRPLTLAQMVNYGRQMSKQKVLQSANHVAEELTIRFAHRIRQMQMLPYRLMGHPALLHTYEQYVDSFDTLRGIGEIRTLEDNHKLLAVGSELLQKHTFVVANVVRGAREIVKHGSHKPEDVQMLNKLVKTLLTSRLSRRTFVKQHAGLTRAWEAGNNLNTSDVVGAVKLNCRILDAVGVVEERAKQNLSRIFDVPTSEMPAVVLEGDPEITKLSFPYIEEHFEFAIGELIYNSLEACLRSGVTDPVVVTASATRDSIMVRISDHGGGISSEELKDVWSFATPDVEGQITPGGLANHQFFSLLFPPEELSQLDNTDASPLRDLPRSESDSAHFGLGLALSRLYVEYWGGALELHSLEGFGCDALLRVSRQGTKQENLRLHAGSV